MQLANENAFRQCRGKCRPVTGIRPFGRGETGGVARGYDQPVPELSRAELIVHLSDQLDSFCSGYDAGRENEAKRLATHARTICHQTDTSTSLLRHLGSDDTVEMRDSVPLHMYGVGPPGSNLAHDSVPRHSVGMDTGDVQDAAE